MISVVTNDSCLELRGLSTDTKPIGSNCTNGNIEGVISNGSVFFEMDTKKVYMFKIISTTVGEVTTITGSWVEL